MCAPFSRYLERTQRSARRAQKKSKWSPLKAKVVRDKGSAQTNSQTPPVKLIVREPGVKRPEAKSSSTNGTATTAAHNCAGGDAVGRTADDAADDGLLGLV